ncbi:NAD(P)-dependent oxidoreductase [Streptomyces sp. NPDC088733]|uniref:NAD(P)-dependent oxidoreductase n=1 Tax=Streptomyces sp. NPDC088733 TaxID=3365880 RepID=UPI0038090619
MTDPDRPRALVVVDAFAKRHLVDEGALERLARSAQVTVLPHTADERVMEAELRRSSALFVLGWAIDSPELDEQRLASAPYLRYIGATQDGRWRFLDVSAAVSRGIACCDASGAMGRVVAEFAFALCVSTLRDLPRKHSLMAAGGWWDGWEDGGDPSGGKVLPRTSVFGSRVGIVGFGGTGSHAADLFLAAGADVIVHSSWLSEPESRSRGLSLAASVQQLAENSDILVVATQPRHDTVGLVSADVLAALPSGAVVVLVGRASTVDMESLLDQVAVGRLRLGIDVYEEEPPAVGHRVRGMPGVVHTPHVAGRTLAAHRLILDELVSDFERVLNGTAPAWATTMDRWKRVITGRGSRAARTAVESSDS